MNKSEPMEGNCVMRMWEIRIYYPTIIVEYKKIDSAVILTVLL